MYKNKQFISKKKRCQYCGTNSFNVVNKMNEHGRKFPVLKCTRCGELYNDGEQE